MSRASQRTKSEKQRQAVCAEWRWPRDRHWGLVRHDLRSPVAYLKGNIMICVIDVHITRVMLYRGIPENIRSDNEPSSWPKSGGGGGEGGYADAPHRTKDSQGDGGAFKHAHSFCICVRVELDVGPEPTRHRGVDSPYAQWQPLTALHYRSGRGILPKRSG
jgi:hypothetical protein